MTLKPLQTAKHVGIKWTPDREFRESVIEPLIKPEFRRLLISEGKVALRSIGIADYDGLHVDRAAHFDETVHDTWRRRHLLQAGVDDVARKRQENGAGYRFKFHLAEPHGSQQRLLIDRPQSKPDMVPPAAVRRARDNMLESVFLDLPIKVLDIRNGDEFDERFAEMKLRIGDHALRSVGWLTAPEAYVTTYQLNAQDLQVLAQRERNSKEP